LYTQVIVPDSAEFVEYNGVIPSVDDGEVDPNMIFYKLKFSDHNSHSLVL